jgi:hypothetical protein
VGNEDPWSIIYKIARNKVNKPNYIGTLTLPSGHKTNDWEESVKALLEKCVPDDERVTETDIHLRIRRQNSDYYNSNLEPDISYNKIANAIKKLKGHKAPGPDGFKGEIIKAVWNANKEILSLIYNRCLRDCVFPNE